MGSVKEIFFLLFAAYFVVSGAEVETTTGSADHVEHGVDANASGHDGNETHEVERYKIAEFDFQSVASPFVISLWIVVASAAKIGFHLNNTLSSYFPESCLLIIVGVILGVVLWVADVSRIVLDSHTFFLYLLPPIILDAGYFMPNRALFDNIGTILLFAVIGTLLNTLLIGFSLWGFSKSGGIGAFDFELDLLHCLVFSSLLSAVDPVAVLAVFEEVQVNEILHIVVFGESLLNDGVTVVLYHLFEGLSEIGQENVIVLDVVYGILSFFVVVGGGTGIGVLFGFLTALVTRFTDHVRVLEPLVVFVMGYLSYLTAEMFHLSGILSCTFCAITMKKYVEANISQKSHTTIKYFLKMLASVSETIIFMVLGISTVNATHRWESGFCLMSLLFCLIYRAVVVVFLTTIANRFRLVRLNGVDQFIIAYGGLRGAIAFSLVALLDVGLFPYQPLFLTTTLLVIYFTVFVQGSTIKPLVGLFRIKRADKHKPTMNEQLHSRMIDHLMAGMEDISGHHGNHNQRMLFENFNASYLKPMLIRKRNLRQRGLSILNVYQKLNEKDAREMLSNGSFADLTQLQNASHSMADHLHYTNLHGSDSQIGTSLGSIPLPDSHGSGTVLDLQAHDVTETRKMRDDGKIHHIMADAMFRPRKQFSKHHRHMLPDMDPQQDQPFHHLARMHLRHVLNHHASVNGHHNPNNHTDNGKPRKNVSFGNVTEVTKDEIETDIASVCAESDSESSRELDSDQEEEGIFFTADPDEDLEVDHVDAYIEPTAVEVSLPWKRNTGRTPIPSSNKHTLPDDSHPLIGEAPSWVENSSYTTASAVVVPDTVAGEDQSHELPLPWKNTEESVCVDMEDGAQLSHVPIAIKEQSTAIDIIPDSRCTTEDFLPPPWPSSTSPPSVPSPSHSAKQPVEEVSHIPPPPWRQNSSMCSPSMSYDLEIYSMKPQASCQSFLMSEAESKHSEHLPSHHIIESTKARHAGDIEMDELLPSADPSMSDTMDRVTNWVLKLNEGDNLDPWNGETQLYEPKVAVTDDHNNVEEASSCDDASTKM